MLREIDIENLLKKRVKEKGGVALKMHPYRAGVPDRLCVMPGGEVIWVELKRPGQKPTKLQAHWHRTLQALDHELAVLDSPEAVENFVREL